MPSPPRILEETTQTTVFGRWRRCRFANKRYFKEFVSHRRLWGVPLVHYVAGRDPQTGRRAVAKGIIAIGPLRAILIVGILTAAWSVLDALLRWPARCPKCEAHVGFEAGPTRLVACPHCGISFQENPLEERADRDASFPGDEGANA